MWEVSLAVKKSFPNAPSPAGAAVPLWRAPCRRVPAASPLARASAFAAAACGSASAARTAWLPAAYRTGACQAWRCCRRPVRLPNGLPIGGIQTRRWPSYENPWGPSYLPHHPRVTRQRGGRLVPACARGTQQLRFSGWQSSGGLGGLVVVTRSARRESANRECRFQVPRWRSPKRVVMGLADCRGCPRVRQGGLRACEGGTQS
jgi:hypothetical protein